MPRHVEEIQNTLATITRGDSLMDMLLELERTVDSVEVFAYRNWKSGELINGPIIDRYFITTTWMYPKGKMPDPRAAVRLEKIGCEVEFGKDIYKKPTRVLQPSDIADPRTKKAKMDDIPVWLVTLRMPIKYITDRLELSDEFIEAEMDKQVHEIAAEYKAEGEEEVADDAGMDDAGGEEGEEEPML